MTRDEIRAAADEWQRRFDATPERAAEFTTPSDVEVPPLVGPHNYTSDLDKIGSGRVRSRAACIRRCTAGSRGRSGSSPASAA